MPGCQLAQVTGSGRLLEPHKLLTKCQASIAELNEVADGLAAAARAYGKTELQIRRAFDPGTYRYQPAPRTP
jgi:hypothetical protein